MNSRRFAQRLARRSVAVSAALVAMIALSCTSTMARQATAEGVKVTVLLFSGRPDPTFQLADAARLAQLAALLKDAPREESRGRETVLPSILGYRGIVVDNPAGLAGLPKRVAVYGGAIEVGTERKEFFGDPENRLASFLLEAAIASQAIPESLLSRIREQGLR